MSDAPELPGPGEDATDRSPRPPVDPRRFTVTPGPLPGRSDPSGSPAPGAPAAAGRPVDAPAHGPTPVDEPGRLAPRRRRWRRVALGVAVVLLLCVGVTAAYVWRTYSHLHRVDVHEALSHEGGSGTNYLIVGTDSREGLPDDVANKDLVVGDGVSGSRSDTLVVMRLSSSGNTMLPIPRDLWVPISGTKGKERINTAIQGGPGRLVHTVRDALGIPIHHYVQVDFAGFLDLVDAVGGVTIDFDAPAFDPKSGLDVKTSGPVRLDRDQALAYVRSRTYTRVVNGKQVVDGRADLGRIERQQTFLRAVMKEVGETRNPLTLAKIGDAVARNLTVDDTIGFTDSLGLARKLAGLDPQTVNLPVTPTRTAGGADVLLLVQPAAKQALAAFG